MRFYSSSIGLYRTLCFATALAVGTACIGGPVSITPAEAHALPRGLTTAPQKVNGSGVTVRYSVDDSASAQQPATVTLIFSAVEDAKAAVRFTTDAGLRLTEASASSSSLPLGMSQLVLQATPQTEGLFYLNVFTTQTGVTSVTSVPVQTKGAIPQRQMIGEVRVTGTGEHIVAIPVP